MTLEERFDALMKQNEFLTRKIQEDARRDQETQAQNKYLQKQLDAYSKQQQQASEESIHSRSQSGACGDGPEVDCLSLVANFHFDARSDLI